MDQKMKRGSVGGDQSHAIGDEAIAKFKYQTLLEEYLELQKENVSRKRKLQAAKLKRETILAEVRFLRRRRNYLTKRQASNSEELPLRLPNPDIGSKREGIQRTSPNSFDLVSSPPLTNKEVGSVTEKDVKFRKKLQNHPPKGKGPGPKDKDQGLTWMGMGDQEWHRRAKSIGRSHLKSAQMVEPTS